MHVYFSGIGGAGLAPLALMTRDAGHSVSGSERRAGRLIYMLREQGITDISLMQGREGIEASHGRNRIDWLVYSSSVAIEDAAHPELVFARDAGLRATKRDEFLNFIVPPDEFDLVAIAGTHGKTTTTAMTIWLLNRVGVATSHSVGAELSFAQMGRFDPSADYFVYECDEFDRNFLSFHPKLAIISGVARDHHEIYPSEAEYRKAFRVFLSQSARAVLWESDATRLANPAGQFYREPDDVLGPDRLLLEGRYNRRDAWLVTRAVNLLTGVPTDELLHHMNDFPGVARRFEELRERLISDSAHTPEEIGGCLDVARERFGERASLVVIYEPLTNRRMHYLGRAHRDVFAGVDQLYWLPTYLAREDPQLPILEPRDLIAQLNPSTRQLAVPAARDARLVERINCHLDAGHVVVAISGGGAGSLDEWLRLQVA